MPNLPRFRKNPSRPRQPFVLTDNAVVCGTDGFSSFAYVLRLDRRLFKEIIRLHAQCVGPRAMDDVRLHRACADWYETTADDLRESIDKREGGEAQFEQPRMDSEKLIVTDDMFYCRGYERYAELPLETQAIYFNSEQWREIARHFGAAPAMNRNRYTRPRGHQLFGRA